MNILDTTFTIVSSALRVVLKLLLAATPFSQPLLLYLRSPVKDMGLLNELRWYKTINSYPIQSNWAVAHS